MKLDLLLFTISLGTLNCFVCCKGQLVMFYLAAPFSNLSLWHIIQNIFDVRWRERIYLCIHGDKSRMIYSLSCKSSEVKVLLFKCESFAARTMIIMFARKHFISAAIMIVMTGQSACFYLHNCLCLAWLNYCSIVCIFCK